MYRTLLALPVIACVSASVLAADTTPAAAPAATASSKAEEKPVAVVNGVAIPPMYAEIVRRTREARHMPKQMLTPESVRDALVAQELLAQDAIKQGLEKEPSMVAALEFQRRELLSKAAIENFVRNNPISDQAIKEAYDKAKAKAGDKEYEVSHILVATKKEAEDLLAKLKNPKNKFAELAKKYSKDSSAENGGDLGWMVPSNLVPEFAKAMTELKKGQISSEPVQTSYGWHIIRVNDLRDLAFPALDKVKGRIVHDLQNQAIRKFVETLRTEAKVEE